MYPNRKWTSPEEEMWMDDSFFTKAGRETQVEQGVLRGWEASFTDGFEAAFDDFAREIDDEDNW